MNTPIPKPAPVPKFRPYLSMAEMEEIICCLNYINSDCGLNALGQSALNSILRTKTLAELALKEPAYTATPRASLQDKLAFTDVGTFVSMDAKKGEAVVSKEDLDDLMERFLNNSLPPTFQSPTVQDVPGKREETPNDPT